MEIEVRHLQGSEYEIKSPTRFDAETIKSMEENDLYITHTFSSLDSYEVVYIVRWASNKPLDWIGSIIDYESGLLDDNGVIELFQYLVDTRLAWKLQGHYGRTAFALAKAGLITIP